MVNVCIVVERRRYHLVARAGHVVGHGPAWSAEHAHGSRMRALRRGFFQVAKGDLTVSTTGCDLGEIYSQFPRPPPHSRRDSD
jgi:hypothetical protein